MKIIALTTAFTLMATLAASGDDVPFAAPPLPQPGEPDTSNLVSLGDIMGETRCGTSNSGIRVVRKIGTSSIMKWIELPKA